MTTSGTTTFTETRDQLITNALTLLQVVAAGETVQAADLTYCASALNAMVKAWMAQGIHLWTEEEGTIYLVNGQTTYTLPGANGSDGSGTPIETSLSATVTSGTTIQVTTSTGMAISDNIGIVLDNNTILWTTITNIVSTTITLNTSITSSATSGNLVFTYTTSLSRPLSIQSARLRNANSFDKMMEIKPRFDYMNIPQKNITGSPIILYYTPQLSTGVVYVWPTPQNVSERLKITYLRTLQDFNSGSDNPDLPQEWLEAITYNLAVRVAPAYGFNLSSGGINGNPDILRQAAQYLDDLKAWDSEQPYIQVVPKFRSGNGK